MQREQNVALLPKPDSQNNTIQLDNSPHLAVALLNHYSFDLGECSANELVTLWRREYPVAWLRLAIIEALYQGRYKAISVQQILTIWQRRKQTTYHFNLEFETLICSKLPEDFWSQSKISLLPLPQNHPNRKVNVGNTSRGGNINGEFKSDTKSDTKEKSEPSLMSFPNKSRSYHFYQRKDSQSPENSDLESLSEQTQSEEIRYPKSVAGIEQDIYSEYQHGLNNAEAEDSLDKLDNSDRSNNHQSNNSQTFTEAREEEISDYQTGTGKFLPPAQTFLSRYRKNQLFGRKRSLSPSEEYLVNSESNLSDKLAKFAPSNINHSPIGQFTPQNSDRSESFTCKLRAMVQEEL